MFVRVLVCCCAAFVVTANAAESRPNIVFILADDLGWADLSCYGQSDVVDTPHIDRLASEGVRFTDFYASCPVCSPTRWGIQAGQYQTRGGFTNFIPGYGRPFAKVIQPPSGPHLPTSIVTPAEALKPAGYATGYFGKYHVNSGPQTHPKNQGYDDALITSWGHIAPAFGMSPHRKVEKGTFHDDFIRDLSVEFIDRESQKENPFFLFVALFEPHVPLQAKPEKVAKYEAKLGGPGGEEGPLPHPHYAAMIEQIDDVVGSIIESLERNGVAEETAIVFSSDNGGLYKLFSGGGERVTDNGPLRSEKGSLYEGGIRVPCIAKWPGHSVAGGVCDEPGISIDFWPTFVEMAGVQHPEGTQQIDGRSLVPLMRQPSADLGREAIYWYYPHYHHDEPAAAVRRGDWKLIRHYDGSPEQLFDLSKDIGEATSQTAAKPGIAAELSGLLDAHLQDVGAILPKDNPNYDPERAGEWWSANGEKPIDLKWFNGITNTKNK